MDGILPFLKPPGITSHDAVAICRRILKEKRIGHSGTLDPMAYGVLPIFLGKATRLIEYTEGFDKTYVAECKFGTFTDTEDSSGQPVLPDTDMVLRDGVVLNESIQFSDLSGSMLKPTFDELVNTLNTFVGVQDQRPSKYSAIKVNSIPLNFTIPDNNGVFVTIQFARVCPSKIFCTESVGIIATKYNTKKIAT